MVILDFNTLVERAKEDLNITRDNLIEVSANTAIHMIFYAEQRKGWQDKCKKEEKKMDLLKRNLWMYYSGKATSNILSVLGRERPFRIQLNTKQDIETFITSDSLYLELQSAIDEIETTIKFLDEVIGAIRFRTQVVRNIIQEKTNLGAN